MQHELHDWRSPLDALLALRNEPDMVCLHSAFPEAHTGRYSFLCWGLAQEITGNDWDSFAPALSANSPWQENAWFGWLGYDLRHATETLPHGTPSVIAHPPLCMMAFDHILRFSHETQGIDYYYNGAADLRWQNSPTPATPAPITTSLRSNMSKAEYLERVESTVSRIHTGDFYQANITRKFYGTFEEAPCPASLFKQLCGISPAPYSAFIKRGNDAIVSSSPECFLSINAQGIITARPIKGSAPRSTDPREDNIIRQALIESAKDQAENRMIVDLMRNDLSRISDAGSVVVKEHARIHSYATIHHLIATIEAKKSDASSTLNAVAHCFPPAL